MAYSLGAQISAIEPPAMVEPVDPNTPPKKRPKMTVVILGALKRQKRETQI
jgi:hypothetical protein